MGPPGIFVLANVVAESIIGIVIQDGLFRMDNVFWAETANGSHTSHDT